MHHKLETYYDAVKSRINLLIEKTPSYIKANLLRS